MRVFDGDKLVLASHNKGKLREIGALLAPFGVEVVSAGDLASMSPRKPKAHLPGTHGSSALCRPKIRSTRFV